MRKGAVLGLLSLTACSGGGTPPGPIVARAPIAQSSAPATAPSQMQAQATFVVHWPSTAQTTTTKRRNTISASTQSISVSVNQGVATIVNKPTSGNLSTSSISIAAPVGSDAFTFSAWDGVNATGNLLDQASTTQSIVADATNTVSLVLDGVCAALVPSLVPNPPYVEAQITTVPLVSGSRSVLKSARLVGPSPQTIQFTRVDADGNTVLASGDVSPITVSESGTTPHVTIAPAASGVSNTMFTLTPIVPEADGISTIVTATSPGCSTNPQAFPSSFQLSTSSLVLVADTNAGIVAYDQDGASLGTIDAKKSITGLAYSPKSGGYLVALESQSATGGINFQTLTVAGSQIGSSNFDPPSDQPPLDNNGNPEGYGFNDAGNDPVANIVYNPAGSDFFIAMRAIEPSISSGGNGTVLQYKISGTTATYENTFDDPYDPSCLTDIPNGTFVVNDLYGESDGQSPQYFTWEYTSRGYTTANLETTSLSYDSTRNDVIDLSLTNTYGIVFDPSLNELTSFNYPPPVANGAYYVSAYNPANDELYMFSAGSAAGLSGTTIQEGGSIISNLAPGAFPGLSAPVQAVVIP